MGLVHIAAHDRGHLLHHGAHHGEDLPVALVVLLDGLRLLEGDVIVARQNQGQMGAAGGLVLDLHHLALL